MKLSIAIIAYNTDPAFLRQTLESIAASTLPLLFAGDYEVCLLDDGSKIDYTDLASEFGVRLLKTENRGMLAARLGAIRMTTGDYIALMDSDDSVSLHYHAAMLAEAERTGADIVLNDWAFHNPHTRSYCPRDSVISGTLDLSGAAVMDAFLAQEGLEQSYYVLWNKLYRREILLSAVDEVEKRYSGEYLCFGDDVLINSFAWRFAQKVVNIHSGYYFYRIHANQSVAVTDGDKLRSQITWMSGVLTTAVEAVKADRDIPDDVRASRLSHLQRWREMISRTHYSYASSGKNPDLYPFIRSRYEVETLRKSTLSDQYIYAKSKLLGENFPAIDSALRPLFVSSGIVPVNYDRRDRYVRLILGYLESSGREIVYDKSSSVVIPRAEIRFRDKIIHNTFVYFVGLLLFRKGSKLRSLLKRKL